ncbi:MAG TPA: hypothetical protein VKY57_15900 [Chitinispirillaceae bacterium]|nr:hypothetical protein [Chitinispirillaceae bacterium]
MIISDFAPFGLQNSRSAPVLRLRQAFWFFAVAGCNESTHLQPENQDDFLAALFCSKKDANISPGVAFLESLQ